MKEHVSADTGSSCFPVAFRPSPTMGDTFTPTLPDAWEPSLGQLIRDGFKD